MEMEIVMILVRGCRPSPIGLAHELGHALRGMLGKMNSYKYYLSRDPDVTDQIKSQTNEEIRNRRDVDNPIRKEQGAKERAPMKYL